MNLPDGSPDDDSSASRFHSLRSTWSQEANHWKVAEKREIGSKQIHNLVRLYKDMYIKVQRFVCVQSSQVSSLHHVSYICPKLIWCCFGYLLCASKSHVFWFGLVPAPVGDGEHVRQLFALAVQEGEHYSTPATTTRRTRRNWKKGIKRPCQEQRWDNDRECKEHGIPLLTIEKCS